ncbi:MAG: sigma-70 family RNA polymerase sigma factor [Pirellulales bacterium]|nr:sigma-70 family RNA polymerase sigma factor [Pirellulales bacterium]
MPSTTRLTLVQRVRSGDNDSWWELEHVYRPLIRSTLRRFGFQSQDVDDLTQEVLVSLHRTIDQFVHNGRPGAFRRWLRIVTVNQAREFLRSKGTKAGCTHEKLDTFADEKSSLSREFDRQHDRHVLSVMLGRVASDFTPTTMESFKRYVIEGQPTQQVARDVGVSVQAVYLSKSRVLKVLREMAMDYDVDL